MSSPWIWVLCAVVVGFRITSDQRARADGPAGPRTSQVVEQKVSDGPPAHPILPPQLEKEDQAVIDREFTELSKITDKKARGARGRELMKEILPELVSEEGRAYASLSMAVAAGMAGDSEFSKNGLRKVLAEFPKTQSALNAANQLIEIYQGELNYVAAAEIATDQIEKDWLSEPQRVYFGCQLATMLVPSGQIEEAFTLYRNLATDHPEMEQLIGPSFEAAAASAMTHGSNDQYYSQFKWIHEHLPGYAKDSRFVGNLAHAAQVDGRLRESLFLRMKVIEEFPEDNRLPEHLLEAASLYREMHDLEAAKTLYEQLIELQSDHPQIATLKELAAGRLDVINQKLQMSPPRSALEPASKESSKVREWLLIANLVVISLVLVGFLVRSWMLKRTRRT